MLRVSICVLAAILLIPSTVRADSAWSVVSGIERFSLRDISRAGPPVDASPIAWTGDGPSLTIVHERTKSALSPSSGTRRLHRYQVEISDAGGFSYDSVHRSRAAPTNDGELHVEGQYEYRRRMLTRRLPAFVEAGIGARASGEYLSLARRAEPSFDIGLSSARAGAAVVLAARVGGQRRAAAEVSWANGLFIGSVAPRGVSYTNSGGGWDTDLVATLHLRITPSVGLVARFADRGDSMLSTHRSFSTSRRQLAVGVTYAK